MFLTVGSGRNVADLKAEHRVQGTTLDMCTQGFSPGERVHDGGPPI